MREKTLKTLKDFESRVFGGAETGAAEGGPQIGDLPQWNLDDLYKSPEDEQLEADLRAAG